MMVPKKSLILAGAALALFGASANAQSQASGKVFSRYNKPLKSVSLDLKTGSITHQPAVRNRAASTTVDFNNNDLGGFVGVDTGNGFCEWFDAAVKGFAGNGSDLMNNIVFAYCSAMLAPGSGGPGGSVKLGFYEGYTWFGGAPTTTVAAFTLNGLPANTGSSSFFGGFRCFFIQVTFTNMVAFADGPIGYSWKFLDVGTSGVLGGTWPFLSCVVSCSGAVTQVDAQGMTDILDEYCPPGNRLATFTFGTTSGSWTSMSMDVREVTDFAATQVAYNATISPNGDTLATVEGKAVVGVREMTRTLSEKTIGKPVSLLLLAREQLRRGQPGDQVAAGLSGVLAVYDVLRAKFPNYFVPEVDRWASYRPDRLQVLADSLQRRAPEDCPAAVRPRFPSDAKLEARPDRAAAPDAEELISYRMPAFRRHGILLYVAAFKRHVGLFPPIKADDTLAKAIAPYARHLIATLLIILTSLNTLWQLIIKRIQYLLSVLANYCCILP